MKTSILTSVSLDDNRPVADQLIESSNTSDYIINDVDDLKYLHDLGPRKWAELSKEERTRAIRWLVSDLVYPGVIANCDYTIICPQDKCCPACHKPMDIFDEPEETGPRYLCYGCGIIITMEDAHDIPGCGGNNEEGEDDG
jgi:hypothetical protein